MKVQPTPDATTMDSTEDQAPSLAESATAAITPITSIQSGSNRAPALATSRPMRLAKTSAIVNLDSAMTPEAEAELRHLQSQEPTPTVARLPRVDADLYQAILPEFQGTAAKTPGATAAIRSGISSGNGAQSPAVGRAVKPRPRAGKGVNRRRLDRDLDLNVRPSRSADGVDADDSASLEKVAKGDKTASLHGDEVDDDDSSEIDSDDDTALPPQRGQLVFSFRHARRIGLDEADLDDFVAFCRELTGESHSWDGRRPASDISNADPGKDFVPVFVCCLG
jgi:hypothetical protein